MGFSNRLTTLIKSHVNNILTIAEDPELILNNAVEEMDDRLVRLRGARASLECRIEGSAKLVSMLEGEIGHWQRRAERLVAEGMEENAREALRRRRAGDARLHAESRTLKDYEERHRIAAARLGELEARVGVARAKRDVLMAKLFRRKGGTADGGGENSGVSCGHGAGPFEALARMEERVERAEACPDPGEGAELEARLIDEEIKKIKDRIKKEGPKK